MGAFLILVLLLVYLTTNGATVSFTSNGLWEEDKSQQMCSHFMCSPNNLTFVAKSPSALKFYNNVTACDALVAKGIKKIYFHGDSYMRQIYAAMLITLNGNFRYGSIADPNASPHCEYHRQFYEKNCGTRQLNHYGIVCGGQLILDPVLSGFSNLNECNTPGTLVMWSFANYKLSRYGRDGVNNATMYQQFFEKDICPALKDKMSDITGDYTHPCSVWWISTHYRVKAFFDDEKPEIVKAYNEQMREYFDSKKCGNVNYVDVYNMTSHLGVDHPTEAEKMTYDGVHWGLEGNLIKAQIIINALLSQ